VPSQRFGTALVPQVQAQRFTATASRIARARASSSAVVSLGFVKSGTVYSLRGQL